MKKLILLSFAAVCLFSCKYDYDCYCIQSGFGAGSKSVPNSKRADAERACSSFQVEVAADTTNLDSTIITCDLVQQY